MNEPRENYVNLIKTAQFNKKTPSLKLLPCRKCGAASILNISTDPDGKYIATVTCSSPQSVAEHSMVFAKSSNQRDAIIMAVTAWNQSYGRKEPPNE